jgi:hypothetical protein
MNVREWIEENYPDEGILLADGFDRAFLGVGRPGLMWEIGLPCLSKPSGR